MIYIKIHGFRIMPVKENKNTQYFFHLATIGKLIQSTAITSYNP